MKKFIFFLIIAALGNTAYHIGQKSLHDVPYNPMLILSVYYFVAMILCLLAMPLFGKAEMVHVSELLSNWRVWLVAVGILLIELGFLLAYQAGGSAQWGGVAVNGVATLILIPLSIFLFRENFSWTKMFGIGMTLSGLYFLVKK
ncbi:hypothetical protein ACKLNO_01865 [Neisseriaceae bacterium B1]